MMHLDRVKERNYFRKQRRRRVICELDPYILILKKMALISKWDVRSWSKGSRKKDGK